MKTIKLFLSLLPLIAVLLISDAKAQEVYFCEDVSSSGSPITSSSVFNISSEGGYLKVLVKIPYKLRSSEVQYDVYSVDSYGDETYATTIYQEAQPDWDWFWKEITFYKTGTYNVYVYDGSRNFLASGQVVINYK